MFQLTLFITIGLVLGSSCSPLTNEDIFDNNFDVIPNIIGGRVAKPNEFPYHVGFRVKGKNQTFCGGSIISDQWILSAGHCMDETNVKVKDMEVIIGSHDVLKPGKVFKTLNATVHPGFSRTGNVHPDLSLIHVKEGGLNTSSGNWFTSPVKVNKDLNRKLVGLKATIAGYGRPKEQEKKESRYIRTTQLQIQEDSKCSAVYNPVIFDPNESDICVGDLSGKTGSCYGDSGAALVIGGEKKRLVVGVLSRGFCPRPNTPAIYVEVAALADWIKQVTGLDMN